MIEWRNSHVPKLILWSLHDSQFTIFDLEIVNLTIFKQIFHLKAYSLLHSVFWLCEFLSLEFSHLSLLLNYLEVK
jgi:hypothetical protein